MREMRFDAVPQRLAARSDAENRITWPVLQAVRAQA